MHVDILSLFPGYFKGPLDESMMLKAHKKGLLFTRLVNIRDFADNVHQRVDDRPYGGGPGMVMMGAPILKAIEEAKAGKKGNTRVIFLSPQGKTLTAAKSRELANYEHLILLCGHYEGIDERVLLAGAIDEEISIGDYVLTNGCLAALVLLDSVVRFIPGVIGDPRASNEDSFEKHLLDCPHYTQPETLAGFKVPEVLLKGNHKNIAAWRLNAAIEKTRNVRPDLFLKFQTDCETINDDIETNDNQTQSERLNFTNISLLVADLALSKRFYQRFLKLQFIEEEQYKIKLSIGKSTLTLIEGGKKETQRHTLEHLKQPPLLIECITGNILFLNRIAAHFGKECQLTFTNDDKHQSEEQRPMLTRVSFYDPDGFAWSIHYRQTIL